MRDSVVYLPFAVVEISWTRASWMATSNWMHSSTKVAWTDRSLLGSSCKSLNRWDNCCSNETSRQKGVSRNPKHSQNVYLQVAAVACLQEWRIWRVAASGDFHRLLCGHRSWSWKRMKEKGGNFFSKKHPPFTHPYLKLRFMPTFFSLTVTADLDDLGGRSMFFQFLAFLSPFYFYCANYTFESPTSLERSLSTKASTSLLII